MIMQKQCTLQKVLVCAFSLVVPLAPQMTTENFSPFFIFSLEDTGPQQSSSQWINHSKQSDGICICRLAYIFIA